MQEMQRRYVRSDISLECAEKGQEREKGGFSTLYMGHVPEGRTARKRKVKKIYFESKYEVNTKEIRL